MRRVLLGLLLVGCSKRETPATFAPDASPPPVAATASAAAQEQIFEWSYAHFESERLFECIDVSLVLPAGADAGTNPLATLEKTFKGAVKIADACSTQFRDRHVLATCAYREEADSGRGLLLLTTSFYDYGDVGLNDSQMADCMKGGGTWRAVSRDSREWQKAKLEHDRRNLRKAVDKLQNKADEP